MTDAIKILEGLIDKYETDMEPDNIEEFRGFVADAKNDSTGRYNDVATKYLYYLAQEQAVGDIRDVNLIDKDGNDLFDLLA